MGLKRDIQSAILGLECLIAIADNLSLKTPF